MVFNINEDRGFNEITARANTLAALRQLRPAERQKNLIFRTKYIANTTSA